MENEKRSTDVGSPDDVRGPQPGDRRVRDGKTEMYVQALKPDRQFETGATRSEEMPYYAAIPYASIRRLALRATGAPRGEVLTDDETGFTYDGGSRKYGYDNWRLGLPLRDTFNHVIQHLFRWITAVERGEVPSGDELSGAAWGIMLPLMTRERHYAMEAAKAAQIRMMLSPKDSERVTREQLGKFMDAVTSGDLKPILTPKGERMRDIAAANRELAQLDTARAQLRNCIIDLERGL